MKRVVIAFILGALFFGAVSIATPPQEQPASIHAPDGWKAFSSAQKKELESIVRQVNENQKQSWEAIRDHTH